MTGVVQPNESGASARWIAVRAVRSSVVRGPGWPSRTVSRSPSTTNAPTGARTAAVPDSAHSAVPIRLVISSTVIVRSSTSKPCSLASVSTESRVMPCRNEESSARVMIVRSSIIMKLAAPVSCTSPLGANRTWSVPCSAA